MNIESRKEPSLVPIERVAMPTNEATDKATRKMITQVKSTLAPRFEVTVGGDALAYQDLRFVQLEAPVSSENIRASMKVSNKTYQLNPEQDINLISGMCFFGATGLRGILGDGQRVSLTDPYQLKEGGGKPIEEVLESNILHISEASTILRISKALQFLEDTQKPEATGKIRCNFHLPVPEYKLYMLELLSTGMLTPGLFRETLTKIDARAHFLGKLLERRVPKSMDLRLFSPFEQLNQLIAQRQDRTTLHECLSVLQKDPLLRDILAQKRPKSFVELPNISYAAGYIGQANRSQQLNQNCLAVEIAEENPIFRNALSQAQELGLSCEMAALYILSDVISTQGRNGKEALFMHDAGEDASPLQELKFVVKNSKGGICQKSR